MVIYKIFPAVGKVNAITVFNKFFNKQCHSAASILFIPPTFTMQSKRRSHQRVYADIIFFAPGFFWNVGIVNIGIPCIVSQWILRHKHNPLVSIFMLNHVGRSRPIAPRFSVRVVKSLKSGWVIGIGTVIVSS